MRMRLTSPLPSTRLRFAPSQLQPSFVSPLLIVLGYTGLYLALALLATLLPMPQKVSPWYPAPSLSLILLLTFGLAYAPALFISSLLSQFWLHGLPLPIKADVTIALIVMAGYTSSAAAIQRLLGGSLHIGRFSAVVKLALVSMIAPLLISSLSVAILAVLGFISWSAYPLAVVTWWIGDFVGILVFTPVLLIWVRPWLARLGEPGTRSLKDGINRARQISSRPFWESLGFGLFVGGALWSAFGQMGGESLGVVVLCLVPLIWIALRHGLPGASIGIAVINIGIVVALYSVQYPLDSMFQMQLVMLCLTLTGLFLGAIVTERSQVRSERAQPANELITSGQQLARKSADRWAAEQAHRPTSTERERRIERQTNTPALPQNAAGAASAEQTKVVMMQREHDELFQIVMATTQELISMTDSSGRYVYVSPSYSSVLGYNPDDLRGTAMLALIHEDDRTRMPWLLHPLIPVEAQPVVLRFRHAQGGWRWVEATAVVTRHQHQPYVVTIARDITAQHQAEADLQMFEAKLRQTQKLESLGLLAGGIAHDFNNLLGSILGNVGLAQLELPPDSPVHDSIAQIEVATRHAADLIRQLLAYAGKGRLIIQWIDPNAIIEELVQLLQTTIAKNVALLHDLAPDLPAVEGDATEIRQVVMNLIVNAAESIGTQPGAIRIKSCVRQADRAYLETMNLGDDLIPGAYVCIEVADTGSGMDETTRARIFEPFFTTKLTGRGLGLAAVLGIIRSHHGALKVDSIPGQGTTFTILLPIKAEPISPQRSTPAPEQRQSRGTILLVDDLVDLRMVARRILEQTGFSVVEAGDGHSAVELVRDRSQDLAGVLLDVTMPHLDGRATARLIHEIKPDLPIVLMSGYSQQEIAEQFKDQRIAGFLQKPFSPHELQQALAQIVQRVPEA